MSSPVLVQPLSIDSVLKLPYDLFLSSVGFESRSRYIAETLKLRAARRVACAFTERRVLAFEGNLSWYRHAGFDVQDVPDEDILNWTGSLFNDVCVQSSSPSICVDISSMSRVRIAAAVEALLRVPASRSLTADFVYALAKFSLPPADCDVNAYVGPALPTFAGWSNRPELPVSAVVGVGYEQNRALGAVELIEPAALWTFEPRSRMKRYQRVQERANELLWEMVAPSRRIEYSVERPFDCFAHLESVCNGLLTSTRPVILPFGPKVFALCAFLVAALQRQLAVWRVTPGEFEAATERIASGQIVGLRVTKGA